MALYSYCPYQRLPLLHQCHLVHLQNLFPDHSTIFILQQVASTEPRINIALEAMALIKMAKVEHTRVSVW